MAIFYITVGLLIAGITRIIKRQWLFWESDSRVFGMDKSRLVDSDEFISHSERNAREAGMLHIFRVDSTLEDHLMTQCGIISGRAVYIAGFCHTGVSRYIFMNDTDHLANAFLVYSNLSIKSILKLSSVKT